MQLKIAFTVVSRKDLRKPLLLSINCGAEESVRGSLYDLLTSIELPENEINRLETEFLLTGHTVLETDKITEADIRRALEPPTDIVKAILEAALAEPVARL